MDQVGAIVALLAPAVLLGVLLHAAWRRGRLGPVFLPVVVLLAVAWILAAIAHSADFRDADGWIDCRPDCSLLQEAVGRTIVSAPITAVLLAILANVLARVDRRRRRGSSLP